MNPQPWRLAAGALLAAALLSPTAHADVVDFDPEELSGVYLPGDSFTQGSFVLTALGDFGVIDTATALGALAPSGNNTPFYFASNDGRLSLAHATSAGFSLDGFSAAFVALDPPSAQSTVLVARGTLQDDSQVTAVWQFAASNTSSFPFTAYVGASFGVFDNLKQVDFYACSWVGGVACTEPTLNNGQFAIDNIAVTVVPEPHSALLMALGLAGVAGLGLRRRRDVR
ncbi:MAG: NF038120 family PEP-CTERM protein [Rubrivivax sp.]|nr:NF038120 family PEP-CTERM protein [Rubrivivax sp.]